MVGWERCMMGLFVMMCRVCRFGGHLQSCQCRGMRIFVVVWLLGYLVTWRKIQLTIWNKRRNL